MASVDGSFSAEPGSLKAMALALTRLCVSVRAGTLAMRGARLCRIQLTGRQTATVQRWQDAAPDGPGWLDWMCWEDELRVKL